jgi:hypothetical protein
MTNSRAGWWPGKGSASADITTKAEASMLAFTEGLVRWSIRAERGSSIASIAAWRAVSAGDMAHQTATSSLFGGQPYVVGV